MPHRVRISSTNPLERLNVETRRRTRVVGIFANRGAYLRLVGMILLGQNEDWIAATAEEDTYSGEDGESEFEHELPL